MGRRGWLVAVYLVALLLLGLVVIWALVSFALPEDEYVEIGSLSDFPPSTQPYELQDPIHVYVVNDNSQILVLDPLNRTPGGFVVRWQPQEGYFIDPSRGAWFDLLGRPVVRHGSREKQGLPRYPITIRDGRILVVVERQVAPTRLPGQP